MEVGGLPTSVYANGLETFVLLYSRNSLSLAVYSFSYSNDQLSVPIIAANPFGITFPSQREANGTTAQIRDLLIREARRSANEDDDGTVDDRVFELILLLDNGSLWRSLLGPWDGCRWDYSQSSKPSVKSAQKSFLVPVNAGITPFNAQVLKYTIPKFAQDLYAEKERKLRDDAYQRPGYDMQLVYSQFYSIRSSICAAYPINKDFAARDLVTIFDDFQQIIAGPDHLLDPSATL
jgi:RNA polymerase I-specific transcription-initiation factor